MCRPKKRYEFQKFTARDNKENHTLKIIKITHTTSKQKRNDLSLQQTNQIMTVNNFGGKYVVKFH